MEPNAITEPELIAACLQGKPAAQRALFERFAGRLMSLCRRYGSKTSEAEDMHQKGWLRIFDNLALCKNTEGPALEAWLRRVMVTTCLNHLRDQKKHKIWQNELQTHMENTTSYDPGLLLADAAQLQAAVHALPEGARLVFNLFAVEGFSHAEVATMLQISEGTSRSQLTRARQLLQAKIAQISAPNRSKTNSQL